MVPLNLSEGLSEQSTGSPESPGLPDLVPPTYHPWKSAKFLVQPGGLEPTTSPSCFDLAGNWGPSRESNPDLPGLKPGALPLSYWDEQADN